ncbi:putative acyl-CoA dehydrogenase [metagenome]|uniref:Putative acyl-CoA dehydrogenase n=1 Tax=metagenome TaxID=256318 RepID=A0A2P2C8L8_9ZZZZ
MSDGGDRDRVRAAAEGVVEGYDAATTPAPSLLAACYDAGLCWVHFPVGLGGLGLPRALQSVADAVLREATGFVPTNHNAIGYGMAAPTLLQHAPELAQELLRPLATAEHIWCQLFSEPGAGSDVASLATRAVRDGDAWVVTGQKVWTSLGHVARYALLVARTDPDVPKHQGMTYFVLDMHAAGVEVRPLRQITGDPEFNEVLLTDARIPDSHRIGAVGKGWNVAITTLMNERTSIGSSPGRGEGTMADAVELWAAHPEHRTPILRDRLARLWIRAEAQRLTGIRGAAATTSAPPGPIGSIGKLVSAELNVAVYEWCMEFLGPLGALYDGYEPREGYAAGPDAILQRRFLRSRANTIEGGTSEIMRNILGERVLGLPADLRADAGLSWKETRRG